MEKGDCENSSVCEVFFVGGGGGEERRKEKEWEKRERLMMG